MKKEFVPYEQALALKELGFNEPCLASWTYKTRERIPTLYGCGALLFDTDGLITNQTEDIICSAPLYQQAFRWLWNKTGKYIIPIQKDDKEWFAIGIVYKTYEEAELECLKKLIEIVKNDNRTN